METNETQREFDWNDEIQHDSEFQLLPEGDYNFEVQSFERARHGGSDKLPPCNKAILKIKVWNELGQTTVTHNLFLHSSCEGMLCAFFAAIGQRDHGQKLKMDWNKVPGSFGRCKLGIREWTSNNTGAKMQSNQITRFYELTEYEKAAFTTGKF
ncbi:MAG: DUF669 domain-containing protein [Clostridia bacterium]